MYQSGRAGDEAKKRKSPFKSGRVGITAKGSHLLHACALFFTLEQQEKTLWPPG